MNLMNLMKLPARYTDGRKSLAIFFVFEWCSGAFFGSLMFICFIKSGFERFLAAMMACGEVFQAYFMNLMNVCVVMVLKGFFENVLVVFSPVYEVEMNFSTLTVHKFGGVT